MAKNIHLHTNDSNQQLSLDAVEQCGSADHFVAMLVVSTKKFGCESPFYFDRWHTERAILALENMLSGAITEAVLKEEYGTDNLTFRSNGLGHLFISGEANADEQCLRFTIGTDQTVIGPFVSDLTTAITIF